MRDEFIWWFLIVGVALAPFAVSQHWAKRWFRIVWSIALVVALAGLLWSIGVFGASA